MVPIATSTWSSSLCVSSSIRRMSSIVRSTQRSSQQNSCRWKLVKSLFSCYSKEIGVTLSRSASWLLWDADGSPYEWSSPRVPVVPTSGNEPSPACTLSYRDNYHCEALSEETWVQMTVRHSWTHFIHYRCLWKRIILTCAHVVMNTFHSGPRGPLPVFSEW